MSTRAKSLPASGNAATPSALSTAMSYGLGNRDIVFAVMVCMLLGMLFIPLPTVLLDFGLAISLALSVLILMVALWIPRPLEFNSFPTILLVVTMLRLALNVSSTRLILTEGHTGPDAAGQVIDGFARFVISGNFVVGIVIFCILVVINFMVIANGSTRISEVMARFSLDAMAGKQMAIDADLGAGLIDEETARQRRKELSDESSFFGSMDGASKFVKGDAIAGIIITLINVVGGMVIGILQHDLSIMQAANNYTTLTIGDGLVTQVPALIVSLSAGLVVTKGGTEGATNEAVLSQLGHSSRALYMAAGLLAVMGVLPGFPLFVFVTLAIAMATAGYLLERHKADQLAEEAAEKTRAEAPSRVSAPEDKLKVDAAKIELGETVASLIGTRDAALLAKMNSLREAFAGEYGILLPSVRITENVDQPSSVYTIHIQGAEVARGEIHPALTLAVAPRGREIKLEGERTREPTFGLDAIWIDPSRTNEAEAAGLTVVDPESVITTHIQEILRQHLPDLMTFSATQDLVNRQHRDYQKLVTEIPNSSPMSLLQHVLQGLLSEYVSIRNLPLIIEAVSEAAADSKNVSFITEHVRSRLSSQICQTLLDENGYLPVLTLSQTWEQEFSAHTKISGDQKTFTLDMQRTHEFIIAARSALQDFAERDENPAILVQPEFRTILRQMLERISPRTPILSNNEVHRRINIRNAGTIGD